MLRFTAHSHSPTTSSMSSPNNSKLRFSAHSHSATTTSPASQYLFSSLSNLFQTWFLLQVNFVANIGGDFFGKSWCIFVANTAGCIFVGLQILKKHFCWTANTAGFLLSGRRILVAGGKCHKRCKSFSGPGHKSFWIPARPSLSQTLQIVTTKPSVTDVVSTDAFTKVVFQMLSTNVLVQTSNVTSVYSTAVKL